MSSNHRHNPTTAPSSSPAISRSAWIILIVISSVGLIPMYGETVITGDRQRYIKQIKRILKANGILFLKCFSDKEPMQEGPYKFSHLFNESFQIDSIKETVYQGTLDPFPRALIVVMINQ
jgi:cyclopropane fatty-acyl-phospholipid synthase-like methyltransferase